MPLTLDFSNAEAQRLRITQEQQKYIEELYKQASKRIGELAEQAPRVPSDVIRQQYLRDLQQQINDALRGIQGDLGSTIREHTQQVAAETVKDAKAFLSEVGLPIGGAYSNVPIEIVQAVASGQLYTGNWTLSRALWLNTMETQKDVQSIVAQGILENKSAYDIAKDLEKYVDPSARKDWEWSKVYPGTRKVVDYNAQRLARTMVSHAYQQAFVRTTIKNPFITKYQWQAANGERVCEICMERDGKLFDKDDLPLDHPNGMCTYLAVIEDSMEDIVDRLADWAHGEDDPELEEWAKDLYGNDWGQSAVPKEEYKYHATTSRNIPGIIEKGLKPSRGHVGNGVYFANSTQDALWWTAETSTGGKTVLRVSLDYLKSLGYEEYTASESGYGVAEGLVDSKIPFDKIQIKVGDNEWWSLSEYAKQYKNSVYSRLSSTAQKRVDRQYDKETEEWIKSRLKK